MATTEITELQAATAFADGDLALIRKSGDTKDRKISQASFIKSIGNPAVKGFTASSDEANKVTLDPSNGTIIDTYYDGMEISFISPINSTGLIQVRIGALAYKDIFVLNSAASVELTTTTYIQAIYSSADNKFYQTNAATTQVYTNEYLAVGIIAGDNSITTYTLTSAYGIDKTEYYNGMSIIFTVDIASKGGVLVNIDGLGNKTLTDKAGDKIANDLLVDQVILAIYDGTNFVKNLFSEEVPEAPELPANAFDENTGKIIPENVPEDNKITVTVGNAGNTYTTIIAALADLVNNYGNDGGNRLCVINLSNTYTWNERVTLSSKDYSWITINSAGVTNVTVEQMLYLTNSSINITGNYSQSDYYSSTSNIIYATTSSQLTIRNVSLISNSCIKLNSVNCTIENSTISNSINKGFTTKYFSSQTGGVLNMKNVTFNVNGLGNTCTVPINIDSNANLENVTVNSTISSNNVIQVGGKSNNTTFTNSTFNGNNNIIYSYYSNLNMINCTTTSIGNQSCSMNQSDGIFTDCNFRCASIDASNFYASDGSRIQINGGNYAYNGINTSNSNITAYGQGTVITLKNNPVGGSQGQLGGVIVVQ